MEHWVSDLTEVAVALWRTTLAFLPRIAGSLVLLLVGWVVARLLRKVAFRLAQRLGRVGAIDSGLRASGVEDVAPVVVSSIIFWAVFLTFIATAGHALGLRVVSDVLTQLTHYLPRVLSGVVVMIAGVVIGNLVRHAVDSAARSAKVTHSRTLGEVARVAVLAIAGVIAVEQFGIDSTVLIVALGLAVGGVIGGLALAFGLGSRVAVSNLVAGRQLSRFYQLDQRISVDGIEGRIISIDAVSVTIDTGEGRALVPARRFMESTSVILDEGS